MRLAYCFACALALGTGPTSSAPAGGVPVQFAGPGEWRELASPPYPKKRDDIIFVDERTGFYGTGRGELYRTDDGGENWALAWNNPGTFIRSVNFIDRDTGFIGNLGPGLAGTSDPVPLYRTLDGGRSWQPAGLSGTLVDGVCAIDILRSTAIVEGRLVPRTIVYVAGRANGPARFARSDDRGEHWRATDLSDRAGMILDVKFLDPGTGFLFAGTDADPISSRALILRTTDGGVTWKQVYRSDRPGEIIWKSSFPSKKIGYATIQNEVSGRSDQYVLKTSDGGFHWRKLLLTHDGQAMEFGIGFVTASRGWVGTAIGGYATQDGGLTWRRSALAPFANKIRTSTANGEQKVYAIGTKIQVLR